MSYQVLTQKDKIILDPDVYAGPSIREERKMWIIRNGKPVFTDVTVIPSLYKIFDEIIVNATDRVFTAGLQYRTNRIDVTINEKNNKITITNNGDSIPVCTFGDYIAENPELYKGKDLSRLTDEIKNKYLIENLFTEPNSSAHYSSDDKKNNYIGGVNGIGAKLTYLLSKSFRVTAVDHIRQLKYKQEFKIRVNDGKIDYINKPPVITNCTDKPYTTIEFIPDLSRPTISKLLSEMNSEGKLPPDMIGLFHRRVYDIVAVTDGRVRVTLNGKKLPIESLNEYCQFFFDNSEFHSYVIENESHRHLNLDNFWNVRIIPGKQFDQSLCFVNGVFNSNGGTHLNYISGKLVESLSESFDIDKEFITSVKDVIKKNVAYIITCHIQAPKFDGQVKNELKTSHRDWEIVPEVEKSRVISEIKGNKSFMTKLQSIIDRNLFRKLINKSRSKVKENSAIKRYIPARWTKKRGNRSNYPCYLILTEGLSARASALAGISGVSDGKDRYGVMALKGKPVNVTDMPVTKLIQNDEYQVLLRILGLGSPKQVEKVNIEKLKYRGIIIMADADYDGKHITALCLNFFRKYWPGLYEDPEFIKIMVTPCVKAIKGNETIEFFTLTHFEKWKEKRESDGMIKKYRIKYYKGLGTNTESEFKKYFQNIDNYLISVDNTDNISKNIEALDLIFMPGQHQVQMRRNWLNKWIDKVIDIDYRKTKTITIHDFIYRDFIYYVQYSEKRAIPQLVDGLKPSQRKLIYILLKMKNKEEIKVPQFVSRVITSTEYHHGDASLCSATIKLAQDFVGSNNLPLIKGVGQFGTRLARGNDASAPRYLNITKPSYLDYVFRKEDELIYEYEKGENLPTIEPVELLPIIPIILVNGARGVGTGESTYIPSHDIRTLIRYIKAKLSGKELNKPLLPSFNGFKGEIYEHGNKIYAQGIADIDLDNRKVVITEIPPNRSIMSYYDKVLIKKLRDELNYIVDVDKPSSPNDVYFEVELTRVYVTELRKLKNYSDIETRIYHDFNLFAPVSVSNMTLFVGEHIKYFNCAEDIIDKFIDIRLKKYNQRRLKQIDILKEEVTELIDKRDYLQLIISDTLKVMRRKKKNIIEQLEKLGKSHLTKFVNERIPIMSLTEEGITVIDEKIKSIEDQIEKLSKMKPSDIWKSELNELKNILKSEGLY